MNFYLNKYGFCAPQISVLPHVNTQIIIVIPCFNETDLISSLNALKSCTPTICLVEVITVINAGINQTNEIKQQNLNTYEAAKKWAKINQTNNLTFHFILNNDLPKKHAGVGLARKIGMDEAVHRFYLINKDGIIVCFDADSKCDVNYLIEIEKHFNKNPKTPGCSIHYEHSIKKTEQTDIEFEQNIYTGIINYELFLRYYNQGLNFCGFPYAYQTVGSSMAVRSSIYQKQGGMNKRKAGEDFYFIHKIIALGNFTNLSTTKVIPSPRISDRVPFGTGKAIGDWIESKAENYLTYDVRIWHILKSFVNIIPQLQHQDLKSLTFFKDSKYKQLIDFLNENNFNTDLQEIRNNSTDNQSFLKRFFVWFNAFKVLKAIHYLRDHQYSNQPIGQEAIKLAKTMQFFNGEQTEKELLLKYRIIEKNGTLIK